MWDRQTRDMMDMWADLLNQIEQVPRPSRFQPRNDVQVNEENGTVTITAELAGVGKDEVNVEVSNRTVTIEAQNDKKTFNWDKTFEFELDPDSTQATMVNGILDMSIEKKEKTSAKKVKIE
jgi:HSP20 family protein